MAIRWCARRRSIALAARGVRFDWAYCQYPLCNPSRVSMLSGRRPDTTGVYDLETPPRTRLGDTPFLPEYFRSHGYRTAHVGKVFHTGDDFEDPRSWDVEIRETGKHPPAPAIVTTKRIERPRKYSIEWAVLNSRDEETADGVVAVRAAAMLKDYAAASEPFFLGVGFRRPHAPYAAPKKYFDLYPASTMPLADEPPAHLAKIPEAALTYPLKTPLISPTERQEAIAAYYACVSFVDAQIGRVLAAIDELGLWKNTVVVLYSDHGYHLGEHGGLWHKMTVFEESARVPMIIAGAGVAAGQPCERLVELLDVYPTLVELCGLPKINELEGHSLRPLLVDPKAAWHDVAYTQVRHDGIMGRSVRTPRWRYTEWDEGRAGAELYDHQADPHEYQNLADDPQHQSDRQQLHKLLQAEETQR